MRRKSLVIILFIVVIVALVFYFTQKAASERGSNGTRYSVCYNEKGQEMNCKKCAKRGESIMHGAGYTCEIKAKDALKPCTFNEECNKSCAYKNGSATAGFCRPYLTNTYDDLGLCDRSKNDAAVNCLRGSLFD
ncbi:MAG: hypothetical protein UT32_C0006G0009 [Parcubacteria group bacterium GW2011_GWC2_39_14]|nr:MAG: hypothetical protein UT32_C0006G0009 [Parcubacteria group bacterium GW2011_GWC2_39_14]KKR54797.1 MAG: hypothetical protein UT91_C0009G0009 [Parcubacteria group bacterium GW2011_GWA2_40_23]